MIVRNGEAKMTLKIGSINKKKFERMVGIEPTPPVWKLSLDLRAASAK